MSQPSEQTGQPSEQTAQPSEQTAQPTASAEQGAASEATRYRRTLVGRVSSDKMNKTVVVEVVRFKMHPMYRKYVRVRKRYKAHDERNECRIGDRVELTEHRPLSREKRFRVSKIIERAVQE